MERFPVQSELFRDADGRWKTGIFYRKFRGPVGGATGVYDDEEARQVFLDSATEYEAAMKFVTSWEHWKAIAKSPHCKPMIDLWREEKMMMDQTEARKHLIKAAEKGNLTAARVIYEAKKEEAIQKKAEKAQQKVDKEEEELLNKSSARILSIKAQS